jgi:hypothetical protein
MKYRYPEPTNQIDDGSIPVELGLPSRGVDGRFVALPALGLHVCTAPGASVATCTLARVRKTLLPSEALDLAKVLK